MLQKRYVQNIYRELGKGGTVLVDECQVLKSRFQEEYYMIYDDSSDLVSFLPMYGACDESVYNMACMGEALLEEGLFDFDDIDFAE